MARKKKILWTHRACGHSYEPSKRAEHYRKCPMMVRERIDAALKPRRRKMPKKTVGSDGKFASAHYGGADNPYETIKVLEAWGLDKDFLLGNAIKYISRAGKKSSSPLMEDLEKALWYLSRKIENLEKERLHAKA